MSVRWGFDARASQAKLKAGGWYSGALDGDFGPQSMKALLDAVSRHGDGHQKALADAMVIELPKANIVDRLSVAHFIAQGAVETLAFTRLEENLNYKAARIKQVWPSRFPTTASAQPYAYKPEALANKVYSGRLGNGSPLSGDGWLYRGRGFFMLTGKENYAKREKETGLPLVSTPRIAADPSTSIRIARLYWTARNIAPAALADNLTLVRRLVNGGAHGLDDARTYLTRAKAMLV
jgi:putative chitinase